MSPVNSKLAVLALASSAAAVPYAHGHGHKQHHHFFHSGVVSGSGAPFGIANATGIWGIGTGASSGFASATGLATSMLNHPSPVGPETASIVSKIAAVETSTCTDSVVSITHTNRITVTVRASEAAPVSETTSASAAPVSETSSASLSLTLDLQNKGKGFNRGYHHTSSAPASSASTSETSAYVAPASTSSTSAAAVQASSASSVASSSAQASATATSSGTGKRGMAYNDASLTTCFEDASEVTWGYNWGQESSGLSTGLNYVPLLWGTSSTYTSGWSDAASAALSNGSTHLMSFNEPDLSSQSNLSPSDAAAAYKTYMMPFAGKAKLGAPAVTNGGGSMGLDWLSAFLDECTDCQIDFVAIHWYDSASNSAYFKEQVQNATDISGGKPVWVTEFGCTDGSDTDISNFLQEVMPWMDGQDFVERYSYFMAADGYLITGTEPSTYGQTFATYTNTTSS